MRDFVLAIVGTIGIVALAMSVENKKGVREDFLGNFPMKTKLEKVVIKNGIETSLEMDQYPLVNLKQKPISRENYGYKGSMGPSASMEQMRSMNQMGSMGPSGSMGKMGSMGPSGSMGKMGSMGCGSSRESYGHMGSMNQMGSMGPSESMGCGSSRESYPGNCLGSSNVTNLPYVSTSNLNQNVNQPSPSMNLPATIRYNAPSTSNMGITDNFQNKQIRENFEPMLSANYSASPVGKVELNKNFNYPENDLLKAGEMTDPFEGKEVMVYDRPMTTTLKVGRFAGRGTRDLIRGDLPVAPSSHKGWFSTPADPSALTKGALQAMGGNGEAVDTMNKFMKIYGDASGVGSGVNLNDSVDYQYTAYEMTNNRQGLNDNTINVLTF